MKSLKFGMAVTCALLGGLAVERASALTLPPPNQTLDGIYYAIKYDDFWSYSAQLLEELRDQGHIPAAYGPYDFAVGSGGLDLLLYTGAGGQSNQGVGPGGAFNFEDPVTFSGGGYWGQNDQDNDGAPEDPPGPKFGANGPVTVGNMLAYLQALDPKNKFPIFYMDLAQPGSESSLFVSARVRIIDPNTNSEVDFWALDAIDNNQFDQAAMTLAAGEVIVQGTSGHIYEVNHNLGSGKPDFLAFGTPDMDLTQFDPNYWFVVDFHFAGEAGAQEEIFLTGATILTNDDPNPNPDPVVPEPASLGVLGLAVLGLSSLRRRR